MQIEIAHELVDAVRDEQMNFGLLEANANRCAASDDQVKAVSELYKVGQIQLDRVLDAHEHRSKPTPPPPAPKPITPAP